MSTESAGALLPLLIDVASSVAGSAACTYTGQPFDTIKVRMQTSREYSSPWDCGRRTVALEGLWSLWRGAVPAFLGAISENAVCFGVNGHLTRMMTKQTIVPKSVEPFVTGGLTGVFTSFALAPFDLIKARSQVNRSVGTNAGSFLTILQHILRTRGPGMLYSGILAQVQCSSLFYASFFGSYSFLCNELGKIDALSESAIFFLSGGFAGQISWAVTLPLDAIKTRIQVEHERPPRMRDVAAQIMRSGGVWGFYRGVEATLIRAFPANAALFLAYEWTKRILELGVYATPS